MTATTEAAGQAGSCPNNGAVCYIGVAMKTRFRLVPWSEAHAAMSCETPAEGEETQASRG